jgi:hypothetical protein
MLLLVESVTLTASYLPAGRQVRTATVRERSLWRQGVPLPDGRGSDYKVASILTNYTDSCCVRRATRSFALRARGFARRSSAPAVIGRLVTIS